MRTVRQLIDKGFVVRHPPRTFGTELVSSAPFYFYEPNGGSIEQMHASLDLAQVAHGEFRLLVGGRLVDDDVFPFTIIDAERKLELDAALRRYQVHRSQADQAAAEFAALICPQESGTA